ncbi:neuroligin-4, X-linked-like [Branchiostoma floridae x Branchiostoma japonicum]
MNVTSMVVLQLILAVAVLSSASFRQQDLYPVVRTQYGRVKGMRFDLSNDSLKPVVKFLGIPYGTKPERFRYADRPSSWTGVKNSTVPGPSCPQRVEFADIDKSPASVRRTLNTMRPFLTKMSEDCLYLNVYYPANAQGDPNNLPVMVYVHGGYYAQGAGTMYDGSALASEGDVVVVTFNFRIGILGFLSTGENNAPGNYGLSDQLLALEWVKKNIKFFNGDPDRITVFGENTGAASITLLTLSPKSTGLFKSAIVQSGSSLATWGMTQEPWHYATVLAHKVDCCTSNFSRMVECLRRKPLDVLLSAYVQPAGPQYFSSFGPVVDGDIVPDTPLNLMSKPSDVLRQFQDIGLLMGVNEDEGYAYIEGYKNIDKGVSREDFTAAILDFVNKVFPYRENEIQDAISFIYTNWGEKESNATRRAGLIRMFTEQQVGVPLVSVANYHARVSPSTRTFLYTFNHKPQYSPFPDWVGSVQNEELPFVFGAPLGGGGVFAQTNFTKSEAMLSTAIITYWTNFAKTGDPNAPRKQKTRFIHMRPNKYEDLVWNNYTIADQDYMYLGMKPRVRQGYRSQRVAFWTDLIPKLIRPQAVLKGDSSSDLIDLCKGLDVGRGILLKDGLTSLDKTVPTQADRSLPSTCVPVDKTLPTGLTRPKVDVPPNWFDSVNNNKQERRSYSTELSVVIAVGTSLFFVNIVVFAVCYHRKDKKRQHCPSVEGKYRLKDLVSHELESKTCAKTRNNPQMV